MSGDQEHQIMCDDCGRRSETGTNEHALRKRLAAQGWRVGIDTLLIAGRPVTLDRCPRRLR